MPKIVNPTQLETAEAIVFFFIRDGALHFCANYRKHETIANHDSYSKPHIDERVDSIEKGVSSSTVDAKIDN